MSTFCNCCGHAPQDNEAFIYAYNFQITADLSGKLRILKGEGFVCSGCLPWQNEIGSIRFDRQWSACEIKRIRRLILGAISNEIAYKR